MSDKSKKAVSETFPIVFRKISDLKPSEYNPRSLTEKQFADLKKSFENLGTLEPAFINQYPGRENIIISGHQRLKVAESLGMTTYPCLEVSFPPKKEKEANIRMNRNTGSWDFDLLANEFDEADLLEWGFEDSELGLGEDTVTEGLTDPDAIPDIPKVAKTKPGDLYILGRHRLLCGDATDIKAVEKLMEGGLADMVFTDPPYNVAISGGTHDPRDKKNYGKGPKIQNDAMKDGDFLDFLRSTFNVIYANMKAGASIYVCFSDSEINNFITAFKQDCFKYSGLIIWVKQQFVFGRKDYHSQHEPIIYGWKEGAAHNFYGEHNQSTIWEFDRPMRSEKEHPTQKPIDLILKAIENSSKPKDVLYEPFGGSGSTLIASEKAGRSCFAMEIDPIFCDVIIERWQKFTGLTAELSNG